jgi:hypothetical protein
MINSPDRRKYFAVLAGGIFLGLLSLASYAYGREWLMWVFAFAAFGCSAWSDRYVTRPQMAEPVLETRKNRLQLNIQRCGYALIILAVLWVWLSPSLFSLQVRLRRDEWLFFGVGGFLLFVGIVLVLSSLLIRWIELVKKHFL